MAYHIVIANEAKQSRTTHESLDCFVASLLAMTVGTRPPQRYGRLAHSDRFRRE
jgi:hypothetical protein